MFRGISLANKCQLLFGAAIVLIIAATLLVPWVRTLLVVDASQLETSRQLARMWEQAEDRTAIAGPLRLPPIEPKPMPGSEPSTGPDDPIFQWFPASMLVAAAGLNDFLDAAVTKFTRDDDPPRSEHHEIFWDGRERVYRFARASRDPATGELLGVVVLERRSVQAAAQLFINRVYLVLAGLLAGALASLVFYLITTRIVLSPVRRLRRTAERVREGDLSARAEIDTGDEYQELGETFNEMLATLSESQERLRSINRSLDLRVDELAKSNSTLYEAAKIKGDFLANVSHELRTPLNSIIGFAELLQAIVENDAGDPALSDERRAHIQRRNRYLDNIVTAGRTLLEMINELLEMAKIESGRTDVRIEPLSVGETCDGLLALIRPQAERKGITLSLEMPRAGEGSLPLIRTDARKFQQVVFNFLSNAVKFTPEGGRITLRAEKIGEASGQPRVRVSVLDTGPGIPPEHHEAIFEKFHQLESGDTRSHGGTGLGLAIAREFTSILQGEIQLESQVGSGSMFSLIVPIDMDIERARDLSRRSSVRLSRLGTDREDAPANGVAPTEDGRKL